MPLRVLVVHPALAPYRIDLFNALARRHRVRFVFLNRDVPYQSYNQAELQRSLLAEFRFLQKGFSVAGRQVRFGVASEIESFAPDVVVTHEFSSTTFAVVARRMLGTRVRHVIWTADNPHVVSAEQPLRSVARRLVLPRIDGLVVYGQETADLYRSRFGVTQPIGLCPNAQSGDVVRRKLQQALPAALGLVERHALSGRKVLLYVGRLAAVKRLDRLIDAFATIRTSHPDTMLVMVGGGPEGDALKARVERLGLESDTIFAGHLEGDLLRAWFNCGTIFALPSEFEPWGAVVNEALLAGMPVVCSDRAGARELIAPGQNGEVVDASKPTQLSDVLARWVGETSAIDASRLKQVRRSMMIHEFDAAIDGFCSVLDAVTAGRM